MPTYQELKIKLDNFERSLEAFNHTSYTIIDNFCKKIREISECPNDYNLQGKTYHYIRFYCMDKNGDFERDKNYNLLYANNKSECVVHFYEESKFILGIGLALEKDPKTLPKRIFPMRIECSIRSDNNYIDYKISLISGIEKEGVLPYNDKEHDTHKAAEDFLTIISDYLDFRPGMSKGIKIGFDF